MDYFITGEDFSVSFYFVCGRKRVKAQLAFHTGNECFSVLKCFIHSEKVPSHIVPLLTNTLRRLLENVDSGLTCSLRNQANLNHSMLTATNRDYVSSYDYKDMFLFNKELLAELATHECRSNRDLRQFLSKAKQSRASMSEVQAAEMELMCRENIDLSVVQQVGMTHVSALERLEESVASDRQELLKTCIAEFHNIIINHDIKLLKQQAVSTHQPRLEPELEVTTELELDNDEPKPEYEADQMELLKHGLFVHSQSLRDMSLNTNPVSESLITRVNRLGKYLAGNSMLLGKLPKSLALVPVEEDAGSLQASACVHVFLGSQLKVPFSLRIQVVTGGNDGVFHLMDFSRQPDEVASRAAMLRKLAQNKLSGVVLPLVLRGDKAVLSEQLVSLLQSTVDFRFPSLCEQLQQTQYRVGCGVSDCQSCRGKAGELLVPGVVLVTRHSSLNGVTAVFHVCTASNVDKKGALLHPLPTGLDVGIRRVLECCSLYGVERLSVPLRLTITTSPACYHGDTGIRKSLPPEAVTSLFRVVKSCLVSLAHHSSIDGCSLKTICFQAMSTKGPNYQQYLTQHKNINLSDYNKADERIASKCEDLLLKIFEN